MMRENFGFISKAEFQCVLGFNFRVLVSGISISVDHYFFA